MKDLIEFMGACILGLSMAVIGVFLLAGIFLAVGYPIGKASCENYSEITKRETTYDFFNGCFVEYNGRLIPKKEFQLRAITNEVQQ